MRIISGTYRGKKLVPPQSQDIKPTTDRAKEALFNILYDKINKECVFLDIFSGSGAIGIEALSRGVKKVFFVDNNPQSVDLIKKNLLGIKGEYEILNMDYNEAINYLKNKKQTIDIVFCDPPYNENLSQNILESLGRSRILNYSGILVIERNKNFQSAESNYFYHYDNRTYALSCFDFYKREKRCALTGTFDPFTNGHLDLAKKAKELFDKVYIVILINEKKKVRYSIEKRKEIIKIAIKDINENIIIDNYDGLTIDYCNKNDIQYILRGARNAEDMLYEQQMADYNFTYGNIKTIIIPASNSISSSSVKKSLDKKEDISELVNEDIISILKES